MSFTSLSGGNLVDGLQTAFIYAANADVIAGRPVLFAVVFFWTSGCLADVSVCFFVAGRRRFAGRRFPDNSKGFMVPVYVLCGPAFFLWGLKCLFAGRAPMLFAGMWGEDGQPRKSPRPPASPVHRLDLGHNLGSILRPWGGGQGMGAGYGGGLLLFGPSYDSALALAPGPGTGRGSALTLARLWLGSHSVVQ